METEITYRISQKDFEKVMDTKLENILRKSHSSRYKDRLVSADTVAEIHAIHRDTVIRYAKAKILPHEMQGKLYKFSLADVLEFDFHELRRKT
jgi:hypothetical protein